jgi:hypothetical protein
MKPFSFSDFSLERDQNEVSLPDNWKPALQPYNNPLSSSASQPIVIGSNISVSSSTVTQINFEPGKNAPVFTGLKSTDVPPNIWLMADDIVTGLDEVGPATESALEAGHEVKFEEDDGGSEVKTPLGIDGETRIDLVVLKKPESSLDSVPIVIPGLPLPGKPTWKKRPTSAGPKRPPSESKLFIQSFLKEYNKTGEEAIARPTFAPNQKNSQKPDFSGFARPVTLATFSAGNVITRPREKFVPKEVVVNSNTIETQLTPEVVSTILKSQGADDDRAALISSTAALYFTTPSYDDRQRDKVEAGANVPPEIDPSDVLKLAYGGSFGSFDSEEDREREKAIDRLIQQLEREYNNSLSRRSGTPDDTGGKSQLTNFRQETTGKWVYLSGTSPAQTPSPLPGLSLSATSDEILDVIKTMEMEVTRNSTDSSEKDTQKEAEVAPAEVTDESLGEPDLGFQEPEIIFLNDETLQHFFNKAAERPAGLDTASENLITEIDDSLLNAAEQDSLQNRKSESQVDQDVDVEASNELTGLQQLLAPEASPITTASPQLVVIEADTEPNKEENTPPFPQGPLFLRNDLTTTTTTTTTTEATTTTPAGPPTALEILTNVLSQSAAPLAGLSAASLAYGAAAMLPLWLPLALGKKRRRRRQTFGFEDEFRVRRRLLRHLKSD